MAARTRAERPAAFTREAILGGTVGAALTAIGAFLCWALNIRTAWIVGLDLGLWALSIALGAIGNYLYGWSFSQTSVVIMPMLETAR